MASWRSHLCPNCRPLRSKAPLCPKCRERHERKLKADRARAARQCHLCHRALKAKQRHRCDACRAGLELAKGLAGDRGQLPVADIEDRIRRLQERAAAGKPLFPQRRAG